MSEQHTTSAPRSLFGDSVVFAIAALVGVMLAGLSIARYQGYNAGMFDLGNMTQAIWSATQGKPLLYTQPPYGPVSRLSGHVEAIYFLAALPYALWPDPRLLLVLQSALFVLGALPVYRMGLRSTKSQFAARCLALIYLLYPTALSSVLFDFHADTLAMPLLLFALDAFDRRAWRRYAVFVALALLCKFYVAAPVAGIGAYAMIWGRQRRAGALTAAVAVGYGLVAFLIVRRLFAPQLTGIAPASGGYVGYYFGQLGTFGATLGDRFLSAVVVFGPVLLVAWRGWRWLLPGLPVAAAALLTTGPGGAYDYRYHHYAIVVPFIIMATIDGVRRMQAAAHRSPLAGPQAATRPPARRRGRSWRGDLGVTLAIVLIFTVLLVDTPLNPLFWAGLPGQGRDASAYGILPRDAVKDRWLAEEVPAGVPLAASNQVAAHLANRDALYLLRYPDEAEGPRRLPQNLAHVDYAVADALFDLYLPIDGGYGGGLDGDRLAIALLLRDRDFGLVAQRDGLLLFQRGAADDRALTNTVALMPDDGAPAEQTFGSQVALVRHTIVQSGPHRLRGTFVWRLAGDFAEAGRFVAVSRLDQVADARMVHLPTYALLPAWEWPRGQLVAETFDVQLPPEVAPGDYSWRLGWYNIGLPMSYATDARSLLPGSQEVVLGDVTLKQWP
jgi:uncharacterized membrane protein